MTLIISHKYNKVNEFNKLSIKSKFLNDLNYFTSFKPRNRDTKKKKSRMYDTASELYNEFLDLYFDNCCDLLDTKKKIWALHLCLLVKNLKGTTMITG